MDEPSQDDLENELSDIIEDTSFPVMPQLPVDTSDLDLEKELEEVLREESASDTSGLSDLMNGKCFIICKMQRNLQKMCL